MEQNIPNIEEAKKNEDLTSQNEQFGKKEQEISNQMNSEKNLSSPSERNENENNNIPTNSKIKRHRRGKEETSGRSFQCPDCNKCYLSAPALTNHRKTKHDYGKEGGKKGRGRPRKEAIQDDCIIELKEKYNSFFNEKKRTIQPFSQEGNNSNISLEMVKNALIGIFQQYQKELFFQYDNITKYPFYDLIINNWDKDAPNLGNECYTAIINSSNMPLKIKTPPLDGIFFYYLKEMSKLTNKEYFFFMIKFIVIFRECINKQRKILIKEEHQTVTKKEYTQIYNAETTPDICNDFVVDFMEPRNFYELEQSELIELIQHFCFWLHLNHYTQSHLALIK